MNTKPLRKPPTVLLSYAFRPFFLLGAGFAILAIVIWLMTLHGNGIKGLSSMWHSHEMLIGFTMAAVAGFSLTAVANWTGRAAIHGPPLAWLIVFWLTGRIAMLLTAWLPGYLVMLLDMLFPVLLCVLLAREVNAGQSKRNYILVFLLGLLASINAIYHLGSNQLWSGGERLAIYLLIHSILILVTIIATRIVPTFTANWLRSQGQKNFPVNSAPVNQLAIGLTVAVGLAASFAPQSMLTGVLAVAAAIVHAFRLSRWRGLATLSNPLLFVLHAAYAWLPVGYTLLFFSVIGWEFNLTTALHALTMGAIGSMVLAVTTRVGLGHTGRPLQAARATVVAYWILMIAVVTRVLGPLAGEYYLLMVDLSAGAWIAAFSIFIWVYWPILSKAK